MVNTLVSIYFRSHRLGHTIKTAFINSACWLRRRIKLKFMFQDYSPVDMSRITLSKLLKCKIRFPFGVEDLLTKCFDSIPKNVRSVLNDSLCSDLINEVRTKQESRLSFDVSYSGAIKYTKEDFQLGIKLLIGNIGMKTKYVDKSTQTPHEVCLYIQGQGVGVILGSPLQWKKKMYPFIAEDIYIYIYNMLYIYIPVFIFM